MPQELLNLVDRAARVHHIAGETVPQRMGMHDVVQTRATRRRRQQIVDRAELHWRTQRCMSNDTGIEVGHSVSPSPARTMTGMPRNRGSA